MKKKYEVFISSTYIDLIKERQEVMEAILNAGHIPVGMELFKAGTPQEDIIKKQIEESDIYVLILGARYGSIRKNTGTSYTNWEYLLAKELGKPIFSIVLTEEYIDKKFKKGNLPLSYIEYSHPSYIKFKKEVQEKLVWNLTSTNQIKGFVSDSIKEIETNYSASLVGWVKNSQPQVPTENAALKIFDKIEYDNDERLLLLCAVESEEPFFQVAKINPSFLTWEKNEINTTILSDNYVRILNKLSSKNLLDDYQSLSGEKQFRIKHTIYLQLKSIFTNNANKVNGLKLKKIPQSELAKATAEANEHNLYLTRNSGKSKKVIKATCRKTDKGYLVLKGSMIEQIDSPKIPFKIAQKRAELRVKEFEYLQEDVLFKSPTYAAAFVIGGHTNGKDDWKTKDGYSLNDLEHNIT